MMGKSLHSSARLPELFHGIDIVSDGLMVPDISISDVTADSSRVSPGALFLACRGIHHHGLEFADQAVANGAAAIAWEPETDVAEPELPATVVGLEVPALGEGVGVIADRFFERPSEQLMVTGITGTNGKTTTAWLVSQALNNLGLRAGYMGTLGFGIAGDIEPSALTTPGVIAVHRRLHALADAGASAVVMEVSSHGLDQGRIDGVRVKTAAFTNLSRDHLDYHGNMRAYGDAKSKLFAVDTIENAVVNVGDPFGASIVQLCPDNAKVISVALEGMEPADAKVALTGSITTAGRDGLSMTFAGDYGVAQMSSPLWGSFNAENLLVAVGVLLAHGYDLAAAADALAQCDAPEGRMQVIGSGGIGPLVVVDFAHTPDALAQALEVIGEHSNGALTVVFGCGGERDKGKRGEMGQVARRLANRIIVTDDNPRFDDPDVIVADIMDGIGNFSNVEIQRDRALAIENAIRQSGQGDVVLVAGKGSENQQVFASSSKPFSDAEVAASVLRSYS